MDNPIPTLPIPTVSSIPIHTYVFYHAGCRDGFCAAWIARKRLGDFGVRYQPVQYGEPIPDVKDGCRVYILDFSYDPEIIISLARRSRLVVVLDHHKTAREKLSSIVVPISMPLVIRFDMEKSGAMLTWHHFNNEPFSDHDCDYHYKIVKYVQDRDLWTWKLPDSREVSAALSIVPLDFAAWDRIVIDERFIDRGRAILAAQNQIVNSLCNKAFVFSISYHFVPCLNVTNYQSEVGEELCKRFPDSPFSATWFDLDRNTEVWSFRSRPKVGPDGAEVPAFDVSQLAKSYGGGGHPQAAGVRVPRGFGFPTTGLEFQSCHSQMLPCIRVSSSARVVAARSPAGRRSSSAVKRCHSATSAGLSGVRFGWEESMPG